MTLSIFSSTPLPPIGMAWVGVDAETIRKLALPLVPIVAVLGFAALARAAISLSPRNPNRTVVHAKLWTRQAVSLWAAAERVWSAPRALLRFARALAPLAPAILLGGCGALKLGFLNAAGPVAGGERHLFLIVAVVLVFLAGPVLILTPLFAWRYRLGSGRDLPFKPKWAFNWPLEGFIWLPPIGIVIFLACLLWPATHKLDPYRPVAGAGPTLRVQAVALDWKWLFIYPDQHLATINELDVPAGRPVHLDLTSATVMQSMLLPQLAGQIYAMAGMSSQLNFRADRPGRYWGEDTQYNGAHFQDDKFTVVARPPTDFDAWARGARASAPPFDAAAYRAAMARSVEPRPLVFSAPPPGLYAHIIQATGGAAQPSPKGPS